MKRTLFLFAMLALMCMVPLDAQARGPVVLRCDALEHPLGDDNPIPLFSWQLLDGRRGARQSSYKILVATELRLLVDGRTDLWDSGRQSSDRSVDVPYTGPALHPETRYYWRVEVWDKDGKPYPPSESSWWETGLMGQEHWSGRWIGYESLEQRSIREANAEWVTNPEVPGLHPNGVTHHRFRLVFEVPRNFTAGVLYVTGEDAAAAWINGTAVIKAGTRPPWGRTPWRTYVQKEITQLLHPGRNLVAIEITHFEAKGATTTPMNAALYLETADGRTQVLTTGKAVWKGALNANGDWTTPKFNDDSWSEVVPYLPGKDPFGGKDSLGSPVPTGAVAALRATFYSAKPVHSARLYATALGTYRFWLNGKAVGDQVLAPGWTDFRERVFYQTYDVTSMLTPGENALGAYLAPGWYSTPLEWIGQGNNYGRTSPALRAQLHIVYADGSSKWITSGPAWKATISPIVKAEIYDGEDYDARRLQQGWNQPGFSDAAWNSVSLVEPHEPEIAWQSFPPIRATETLAPRSVASPQRGVFVFDFGQNLAGYARIRLQGKAGETVQLRFGESLNSDGTLYVANLRNAKATDRYTFAGDGIEEYEPSFTFHGFRYVELTGVVGNPGLEAVRAVAIHTYMPVSVAFKTGSPIINQLWSNILWGQRSNFVGVPTDCPQRDERLGWSADAQVFWRTASYNMDTTTFSRKYAEDLRGTQDGIGLYGIYAPGTSKTNPGFGPGWSDAGILIPWTSWLQNGDKVVLQQNWSAMKTYLATILAANPDYLWRNNRGIDFGDWLSPEGPTDASLLATAYWAYDASRMEQMAHALSLAADEQNYADLFEKIRSAFEHKWIHEGGVVGSEAEPQSGPAASTSPEQDSLAETQTGYVLALYFRLLPDSMRTQAAANLVGLIQRNGGKLGTGFLGTPYLLEVLSEAGHVDLAYRLLLSTEYPSWGYMVTHGATTMWERWNGDKMIIDPGMNSFNHYAYGAVGEWMYRYAAGVDALPSDPGFHTVLLHPNFNSRLGSVDFAYESRYGAIRSRWAVTRDGIKWKITIPANTRARIVIPTTEVRSYTIDGIALREFPFVRQVSQEDRSKTYEIPAGSYFVRKAMGRYGTSTIADVTARSDGKLSPLHTWSALSTVEWHATPRSDVYANYGGDYVKRTNYTNLTTGNPLGYGVGTISSYTNAGCSTEPVPNETGGTTNYPATLGSCSATNRDIQKFTVGYWYDFYKGARGRFRQGIQYGYARRKTWADSNRLAPEGLDNIFENSFRYYLQ